MDQSELHVYYPNADQALSLPSAIAWMTGTYISLYTKNTCLIPSTAPGVYHGNLNHDSNSDDLIDGAQLLPYPIFPSSPSVSPSRNVTIPNNIPISMVFTEFHFVLLYRDRVVAVSTLNEEVTYEDILPLVCMNGLSNFSPILTMVQKPNEQVQGITADPVRKTYWVYTDQAILELEHKNEDRDIWKVYLEKGRYDAALQYAKVMQWVMVRHSHLPYVIADREATRHCHDSAGPRAI